MVDSLLGLDDSSRITVRQTSLSEGGGKTWGGCNVFLGQRKKIFQQNLLVVAVGIKVYDSRGVAHAGDGGRVELLVLQQISVYYK